MPQFVFHEQDAISYHSFHFIWLFLTGNMWMGFDWGHSAMQFSVMQKILAPREVITVDAACIVAMSATINFQLKSPNQLRRAVFGVSISSVHVSLLAVHAHNL